MDLQQLRIVVAVADCGSISAAARRLYTGQPGLSKSIRELEAELGCTLFRRTARGVELTQSGRDFVTHARSIVSQVDAVRNLYRPARQEAPRLFVCAPRASYAAAAFYRWAIDAAKAMWVFYEYPTCTFEQLITPFSFPELRQKAKFCAIPSTSGTATEVTAFSVITDYHKGIKYPLADFNITPDVAIVDPELAETMPKKLTAHTGMDAMTHAIEAYVSTAHCNYTDPLALHAIKMIHNDLKKSYDGDMDARDRMHDAQCLAGMAFSNALLGIVHSMAHKTGAAFSGGHIIHGAANAMYLPKVIQYNAKVPEAAERYAEIARFIGLPGETADELVRALVAELREMNRQLNIPLAIKNYGEGGVVAEKSIIDEGEFNEKLHDVAANAIADACTGSNPRQPSQEDMEKLLLAVYYDKDIDF